MIKYLILVPLVLLAIAIILEGRLKPWRKKKQGPIGRATPADDGRRYSDQPLPFP